VFGEIGDSKVAKGSRSSGKVITKTIGGHRGKRQEFPINSAQSNASGDKKVFALHYALLVVTAAVAIALAFWGGAEIYHAFRAHPIDWWKATAGTLAIASVFFVGRGLLWISIMAPTLLAAKLKSWKSQEDLCRKALKFSAIAPGGGLTAAMILVQSLVTRGQFPDAIAIGEEQHKRHEKDPNMAEGLGPICSAISIAYQMQNDAKQAIVWSDRALASYTLTLENYGKKKSWFMKLADTSGGDVVGNIRTQMTVAYFNNGSNYFAQQNFRMAKVNFQKTVEIANQAPEFPEKSEIVRACKDQLARLKHN
jgi:hypothetical protein